MIKIVVRCNQHQKPVTFYVHEQPTFLAFICADCGARVSIDVTPQAPDPWAPAPTKETAA